MSFLLFNSLTDFFISFPVKEFSFLLIFIVLVVIKFHNHHELVDRCKMSISKQAKVAKYVHWYKYSSPSIFYYIFHIKPHFFKKYFKAISGQIFMKFISRHAEFFEFYLFFLIVKFVCMVFVFWWFKHKCWFFRFYFC